ncbi:hypothetical protein F5X96DRAFT_648181 [Biscogniauxia mediterranea]|nr:hypothetical protein F5X96DRAFT_648181 [Biscogniauxia mediterranea]
MARCGLSYLSLWEGLTLVSQYSCDPCISYVLMMAHSTTSRLVQSTKRSANRRLSTIRAYLLNAEIPIFNNRKQRSIIC